jgi:hypothetical protein
MAYCCLKVYPIVYLGQSSSEASCGCSLRSARVSIKDIKDRTPTGDLATRLSLLPVIVRTGDRDAVASREFVYRRARARHQWLKRTARVQE